MSCKPVTGGRVLLLGFAPLLKMDKAFCYETDIFLFNNYNHFNLVETRKYF
jgi:hypothetical protein